MEGEGSFQRESTCCLRIKCLAITLSAALMRKLPEQWNLQLSNSFYHLQQKFKETSAIGRVWVGGDEGPRYDGLRSI